MACKHVPSGRDWPSPPALYLTTDQPSRVPVCVCWCFCSAKFLFVVMCSAAERTTPSGRARDSKETLIKHFARRYHIAVVPHRILDVWIRASPLCIYPLPVTGDADGPTTKARSLEILLERHLLIKMRTVGFFVFALHSSFSANVLTTVSFVEMFRMQVSSATPRRAK